MDVVLVMRILIFLILVSCNGAVKETSRDSQIRVQVEEYDLPCPPAASNALSRFSVYNDHLYIFNSFKFGLDEIDLKGKTHTFYPSENDGPNAVKTVNRFKVINKDSVVVLDDATIHLCDMTGRVYRSFGIIEPLEQIKQAVYAEFPNDKISNELIYDPTTKSVYFYFASALEPDPKYIFARFSLLTANWEALPIKHPPYYDGIKLNYTAFPSAVINKEKFSFIYTIAPIVSQYDFDTQIQSDTEISSFSGKQYAEPQTGRETWSESYFSNWLLTNPAYTKLLFDPYRDLYYRMSVEALNGGDPNNYHQEYITKSQPYLTILDPELNVLQNIKLQKNRYNPSVAFVFSEGLWVAYNEGNIPSEEYINGDLIRICGDFSKKKK